MIRLTNLADYGVVLMAEIAAKTGLSCSSDLVAITGLPTATVGKLLNALARAELLISHRGAQGGFEVAKPLDEISIADVVAAIEGPIALTHCTTGDDSDCQLEPICRVRPYWNTINRAVNTALAEVKLSHLSLDTAPKALLNKPKMLAAKSDI